MESGIIDLVVTSPPYDSLRDYDGYSFDVESIAKVLHSSVKQGGVVVWVVGDQVKKGSETGTSFRHALAFMDAGFRLHDTMIFEKNSATFPARKTGKRYSQIFEYMFVFSKGAPKTANLLCDKENKWAGVSNWGKQMNRDKDGVLRPGKHHVTPSHSPRNNIWKYSTGGNITRSDKHIGDHPAAFPLQLARDHILTWSNPGDTVLDPMVGSGTTCVAALELGRECIGIDFSEGYLELARKRCKKVLTPHM
jgi:site-specific DNA-methyltransferase (adenine-specific)